MRSNFFDNFKNIYFIGIGGIGISAIARMLISQGKKVSGSDSSESEITKSLEKIGAQIFIGQKKENLSDCIINMGIPIDLFIYTVAIKEDNPEFIEAKSRGVKMMTYAQTLNEISKEKYTIAISGTHGKTTVTAMIAKIMIDAGLDPTVIVGSLLKIPEVSPQGAKRGEVSPREFFQTNFIVGKSKPVRLNGINYSSGYLVVEACEYKRSFLNIEPKIAVINNIDADHLDYYGDLNGVISGFNEFAQKVPEDGFIVCDPTDEKLIKAIAGIKAKIINRKDFYSKSIKLLIPGEHNRLNAATAIAVAKLLNINTDNALKSLESFSGTWRRFEYKGKTKIGALVYDDYAHNPQKVVASLQGAREMFKNKRIVVVFQPHLYSRTKLLLKDFAKAFKDADEVILAPIYPAREPFDPTISSKILADKVRLSLRAESGNPSSLCNSHSNLSSRCRTGSSINNKKMDPGLRRDNKRKVLSFVTFSEIEKYLKDNLKKDNVLITMGAGDVYKISENLVE